MKLIKSSEEYYDYLALLLLVRPDLDCGKVKEEISRKARESTLSYKEIIKSCRDRALLGNKMFWEN